MRFTYNLSILLYGFALRVASLFIPKAKLWIDGRKNQQATFPLVEGKKVVWFHCASLGEFDQGLPLMNLLKKEDPTLFLLVTFFSPSGFEHYHKRQHSIDFACYIPLDTTSKARKFVAHFKPEIAVFVKYEFWSNFIFALKKNKAQLYSVSTILRPEHRFFKWYGGYFRKTLKQFDYFFVQNESTKKLLATIDIHNVEVTGDNRFDRVIENKAQLQRNPILERFTKNAQSVLICGSTWPVDEAFLQEQFNGKLFDKIIIAPHNIDSKHISEIEQLILVKYDKITSVSDTLEDSHVLILDTIGQLSSAYSYATVAYVGGGFTGNLHNILEPAVFGLPVIFGPKHRKFPEAESFIQQGFGFSVSSQEELQTTLLLAQDNITSLSQKATNFVEQNAGASLKVARHILTK